MDTVSFAVPIPPSAGIEIPESASSSSDALKNHNYSGHGLKEGVVGTITFLGDKSILVHFGWGLVLPEESQEKTTTSCSSSIGSSTNIAMGPLVVAMPPKHYQGAFSDTSASTTKSTNSHSSVSVLLPCIDSETMQNQQIATHTADRLAQRLGISVMVSCDLVQSSSATAYNGNHNTENDDGANEQAQIRNARAAALAEQEIRSIVQKHLSLSSKTQSS
jgi:hypothetical protein